MFGLFRVSRYMQSIFTFLVSVHTGTNTAPTSEVGTSTY